MISLTLGLGLLALLGAALLAPLGVVGLRERGTQRGKLFAALMFCLSGWATGVGLGLIAQAGGAGLFDILIYAGMAASPVLWLQFNLSFTEHPKWLAGRRAWVLWIPSALFLASALTNPLHHWITYDLQPAAEAGIVRHLPAGAGWLFGMYAITLGTIGAVVLLHFAAHSDRLRRAQAITLFCACTIPLIVGFTYIVNAGPLSGVQLTAQSFVFSALILWFGVIRFNLLSVPPRVHRILFENMSDAALVVDEWDNLVEANPMAMTLFGISDTDLSRPFATVIRWPEMIFDRLQTDHREIVRAGPAGSEWYEVRVVPLPSSRPERPGALLLMRNISDARRARQQLERSEALYRSVVERQGEGIAIVTADEEFSYANPAAETILGVASGTLIGRNVNEFLTASQIDILESQNARNAQGETTTYELSVVRGDGAERVLLVTSAPHWLDGRLGAFAIFRDITDSRSAERLSLQWRQRYELVSAISGQLVYFHDAITNAVEWGESVHHVFGYTHAEMTGGIVQWANLLHPADRQRVLAAIAAAQDAFEDQYRLQHKLGHYLLIHAHILPMRDEAGALLGYVGVLQDISRQHKLQQAVLSHARRLEQLQALSLALSSQRNPDSLHSAIVQGAVRLLNATAAVLYAVNPVGQTLHRIATEPARMSQVLDLHPAYNIAQQVVATQQIQKSDSTARKPVRPGSAVPQFVAAAHIGVPIFAGSTLSAVLVVEDNRRTVAFDAADEQLIRLLANQAAAEVANSRLLADAEIRAQRLLLVNEITTAVIQVLDLTVVLQHIVDGLARVLSVDYTRIALFDEAHQRLTVTAHHTPDDILHPSPQTGAVIGNQLLRLVLQTREPLYIADAATDPRTEDMRDLLARHNTAALLVIPIVAGEEVMGVIVADFVGKQQAPGREDLRIGETLSNLAAVRIQQVRSYNTLQRLSIVDELTQVYNFRALFEIGENEFTRSLRHQRPLSAIFVDIDHFRDFNNRYSHNVGNQVLRAVGRRLLAITRTVDLVARFGGEEFVVLLPETDLPLATTIGYRIHQEIGKLQVVTDHGPLGITVSVGVATRADSMHGLQELIERANLGEHHAKAGGRNRVVVC